jgi:hypothetical protein
MPCSASDGASRADASAASVPSGARRYVSSMLFATTSGRCPVDAEEVTACSTVGCTRPLACTESASRRCTSGEPTESTGSSASASIFTSRERCVGPAPTLAPAARSL